MDLSFKRAAEKPQVVDAVIQDIFPDHKNKTFTKVFSIFFPDSLEHSHNMQSFLEVLGEFRYSTPPKCREKQAVDLIHRDLDIAYLAITGYGVYQFWTYLIKIYQNMPLHGDLSNFDNILAFMNEFPINNIRAVIVRNNVPPNFETSTQRIMNNINEMFRLAGIFNGESNPLRLTEAELEEEKLKSSLITWIKQGVLMIDPNLTRGEELWSVFAEFFIQYFRANFPNVVFNLTGETVTGHQ